ncbi:MAG TPA: aspartate/glutamate racemase family protein [Chloroflexota bacterium]|nr:aspartate/glutamate racemase family protein [Chloroflexota bacterium]
MRVLVINPNASVEMSDVIREQLHAVARPDVQVDVVNPPGAPPAIESALDEAACVPPMLQLVREASDRGYDAVVIACFSDPGLDAAREATDLPVVGIQDAAMHLAAQIGYRFSVLTTLAHRAPLRERAALLAGLDRRLASCRPLDLPVLETVVNREQVVQKIVTIGRQAIEEDGAEVLVLGCAGLGDLALRASQELGVPVIDPNAAALKLCETLVDLRLSHSRAGLYRARPREDLAFT